ncbi:tRNA preQ1(34) S-adenosylmethionine ribosyltransferase-isomerase QueA [Chloroflexota bacterium]
MKTADFDYELPPEFIAQTPAEPRDSARLLVLERGSGSIKHCVFRDLGDFLEVGDLLVLNETRVIPARLYGRKIPTAGRVEILLLRWVEDRTWECLVRGKGLLEGRQIQIEKGPQAEIVAVLEGARRLVHFEESIESFIDDIGNVPLPPYIRATLSDPERYQTVYASQPGSVAAPTAGLHFTRDLIMHLRDQGIRFTSLTLHVGLDTFAPVTEDEPVMHTIHSEWCQVSNYTAEEVNHTRREGGRIIAVGTTSVRALETAAQNQSQGDLLRRFDGATDLFILPGYKFRVVDAMITNFHLPRSTLFMLVSAFAGRERVMDTYQLALVNGYRFYSFGDVMLII